MLVVCIFLASYRFQVIHLKTWPKLPKEGVPKCFGEKRPPKRKNFKISQWNDSCGQWFTYSCQVLWKSVKQKWPNWCVVLMMKKQITEKLVFGPFLWRPWSDLNLKFYRIIFPHPNPSAKFRSNPFGFLTDIHEKVFYKHYNISMKPTGFTLTINSNIYFIHQQITQMAILC